MSGWWVAGRARRRLALLAAAGVAPVVLAATATAAAAADARRLEVDGVAVYAQQLPGETISMRAYVRALPTASDPIGIAALMAAWMARGGTESFSGAELATVSAELGLRISARAGGDLLILDATVRPDHFRASAKLIADLLMYPSFDPAVAKQALADARAASERVAAQEGEVPRLARRALGVGSPPIGVGRNPIDRASVVAFHQRTVGVDSLVLVMTGAIQAIELERDLRSAVLGFRRARQSWPAATAKPGATGSLVVHAAEVGQSRVVWSCRGLHRADPDWLAVELGLLSGLVVPPADDGSPSNLLPRIHWQQPLGGPDVMLLERSVLTAGSAKLVADYGRVFAAIQAGRARPAAIEQARNYLAMGLIPPPSADSAAVAHGLLEALGMAPEDPAARYARLMQLGASTVAATTAKRLGE